TFLATEQEIGSLRDARSVVQAPRRLFEHGNQLVPNVAVGPVDGAVRWDDVVQDLGMVGEMRLRQQPAVDRRRPPGYPDTVLRVIEDARRLRRLCGCGRAPDAWLRFAVEGELVPRTRLPGEARVVAGLRRRREGLLRQVWIVGPF